MDHGQCVVHILFVIETVSGRDVLRGLEDEKMDKTRIMIVFRVRN